MTTPTPPLADHERTRCEIWSRVMGYHRPVSSWNIGKQQEHRDRLHFREPADPPPAADAIPAPPTPGAAESRLIIGTADWHGLACPAVRLSTDRQNFDMQGHANRPSLSPAAATADPPPAAGGQAPRRTGGFETRRTGGFETRPYPWPADPADD